MKKIVLALFSLVAVASAALAYEETNKIVRVEGPERTYNMVRITNNTHYTDFSCTVYVLAEDGGRFWVDSTLGVFHLGEYDDTDSNTYRVERGMYLGIKLPEGMEDVTPLVTYKDLPLFDIVKIILTEDGYAGGEEF